MYALTVGLQGVQPVGEATGLADPLRTVLAARSLLEALHGAGYGVRLSSDFAAFARQRFQLRSSAVSPMFDPQASRSLNERGFWMALLSHDGATVGLQAFRLDDADPNLAEWVLGWMMGLYAKRREMIVPRAVAPPEHSLSHLIRGQIVYHGELWIDKAAKGCFPAFPKIGMLLAMIKWQPEAIWALTGQSMATRGHMVRMGYGHLEQSFLTWEWEPDGAEQTEWIGVALRRHLEFSIAEMIPEATEVKFQPSTPQ
ncbi:hypothetical protein [Aestuariivirga sp.]|jgi:hypothetical protein|uniref:hypothetical protein n=1 Tax=Aestuariivirga sp. TaxID=2650926 RepID=UPI0037846688